MSSRKRMFKQPAIPDIDGQLVVEMAEALKAAKALMTEDLEEVGYEPREIAEHPVFAQISAALDKFEALAIPGGGRALPGVAKHFSDDDWFSLPVEFRHAWWDETNYGTLAPRESTLARANALLAARK